jgi:hypothetical protein
MDINVLNQENSYFKKNYVHKIDGIHDHKLVI